MPNKGTGRNRTRCRADGRRYPREIRRLPCAPKGRSRADYILLDKRAASDDRTKNLTDTSMPKLVINPRTTQAREMELKPGKNTFGRGFGTDFRIGDPSVSAMHAEIVVDAGSVTVRDLRSTNGTFINRSQIREAFLQPGQAI